MWRVLTLLPLLALCLWGLTMPAGDVGLYHEVGGGTTCTSDVNGTVLALDTIDAQNESTFSKDSGGIVTVKEACRVLYFAGCELEKTAAGAETASLRMKHDPNTGTFAAEHMSWDMCWYSDANGVSKAPLAIAGIANCVASSKLQICGQSEGSDLAEAANRTWLHLIRLPASAQVCMTTRNTNQTGMTETFADISWNNDVITDSSWTRPTAPELKWTGGTVRALLLVSVTYNCTAQRNRCQMVTRVLKNGTAIAFGRTFGFIRGTSNDFLTTCRLVIPVDLTTNDILKVQGQTALRVNVLSAVQVQQSRAGIAVIVLPDNVNWLAMRNSANQGADAQLDFSINTEDVEANRFSHSSGSEITINNARRYVFGYTVAVDRTSSATADDINWDVAWRKNNASDLNNRGSGSFTDGLVTPDAFKDGTLKGAQVITAVSSDIFELRLNKIGSGADSSAVFVGGAGTAASLLWAFDLDDVFACTTPSVQGESDCKCTLTIQKNFSARVEGESDQRATLGRLRGMGARIEGESDQRAALGRDLGLGARVEGESDLRQSLGVALGVQARAEGDSAVQVAVGVDLGLQTRTEGEQAATLALGLDRNLAARAEGEADLQLPLGLGKHFAARAEGEASALLPLGLGRFLGARIEGDSASVLPLSLGRHLGARMEGESDARLPLGLNRFIGARIEGESDQRTSLGILRGMQFRAEGDGVSIFLLAIDSSGGGATNPVFISCLLQGESQSVLPLSLDRYLGTRMEGESALQIQPGVIHHITPRAEGDSASQVGLGIARQFAVRVEGESLTLFDLTRIRDLQSMRMEGGSQVQMPLGILRGVTCFFTGEGLATFSLSRNVGIQTVTSGEVLSTLALGIQCGLTLHIFGESLMRATVLNAISNRIRERIQVVRFEDRVVVTRAQTRMEVLKARTRVIVPRSDD